MLRKRIREVKHKCVKYLKYCLYTGSSALLLVWLLLLVS